VHVNILKYKETLIF